MIVAFMGVRLFGYLLQLSGYEGAWPMTHLNLIADQPVWLQFVVFLVLKDFLEWNIHILLHRFNWLWAFHKVHHSIRELDWIGNFRFHIVEIVVYRSLTFFPLVVLGVENRIILAVAIFATFIGHLNHANIKMDYGPLRFLFNSPRLHVWHHDRVMHGKNGQNFAIVFSLWDWLFSTIYYPDQADIGDQPQELGFDDFERYPASLAGRFFYPLSLALRGSKHASRSG